jgi:spore maturation protein CgeB
MKIFLCENLPIFVNNLVPALNGLGHHAVSLLNFKSKHVAYILRKFQPDLIITVGWTKNVSKENLKAIRTYCERTRAFHVYWSLEDPVHMETWSLNVVRTARPDYVFSHDPDAPQEYQALGFPSSQLMHACNPDIHRPVNEDPKYKCDIALVANFSNATGGILRKQGFETLLFPLLDAGFNVKIYGQNWNERFGRFFDRTIPQTALKGAVSYSEVPKIYSSAKIILGLQNFEKQLTRRTFEALACRGCLLTLDTPGVRACFKPGFHLLAAKTAGEAVNLARYYLNHPEEREQIAGRGQTAVYRKHTFTHRMKTLLKRIAPYDKMKKKKGMVVFNPPLRKVILKATDREVEINSKRLEEPRLLIPLHEICGTGSDLHFSPHLLPADFRAKEGRITIRKDQEKHFESALGRTFITSLHQTSSRELHLPVSSVPSDCRAFLFLKGRRQGKTNSPNTLYVNRKTGALLTFKIPEKLNVTSARLSVFLPLPLSKPVRVGCYVLTDPAKLKGWGKTFRPKPVIATVGGVYPKFYPFTEGWNTWDITPALRKKQSSQKTIHILLLAKDDINFSIPFAGTNWKTSRPQLKNFYPVYRPKLEIWYK